MGAGPNMEKMNKILERNYDQNFKLENERINYKYLQTMEDIEKVYSNENNNEENSEKSDDSFNFSLESAEKITNNKLNIKNTKIFPYSAIGILSVQFPQEEQIHEYTCFLINENLVITLASNLINKENSKAISVKTSFSEEEVEWENIYLEENYEIKSEENKYSPLAAIIYDDNISKE